jgi:hypothetical protein
VDILIASEGETLRARRDPRGILRRTAEAAVTGEAARTRSGLRAERP